MKKYFGFTLGEIMIAMTVIGIVAVLIIPQMILGQKASRAGAQFKEAYSTVSKIVSAMETENKSLTSGVYATMKTYARLATDCGASTDTNNAAICTVGSTYKTLNSKSIDTTYFNGNSFVLKNGMLISVKEDADGKGILVSVDTNGKNRKPNKWGWDLFTFEIVNDDILPQGAPGTKNAGADLCSSSSTATNNGLTCAYQAMSNENYFKNLYKGH